MRVRSACRIGDILALTMERTINEIERLEQKIENFQSRPDQNPESDELELDIKAPERE